MRFISPQLPKRTDPARKTGAGNRVHVGGYQHPVAVALVAHVPAESNSAQEARERKGVPHASITKRVESREVNDRRMYKPAEIRPGRRSVFCGKLGGWRCPPSSMPPRRSGPGGSRPEELMVGVPRTRSSGAIPGLNTFVYSMPTRASRPQDDRRDGARRRATSSGRWPACRSA